MCCSIEIVKIVLHKHHNHHIRIKGQPLHPQQFDLSERTIAVYPKVQDLDIAIAYYKDIVSKVEPDQQEKVRGRIREAYAELLAHLSARGRYREAVKKAQEALKDFERDVVFKEALETCRREAISLDLRHRLLAASRSAILSRANLASTLVWRALAKSQAPNAASATKARYSWPSRTAIPSRPLAAAG